MQNFIFREATPKFRDFSFLTGILNWRRPRLSASRAACCWPGSRIGISTEASFGTESGGKHVASAKFVFQVLEGLLDARVLVECRFRKLAFTRNLGSRQHTSADYLLEVSIGFA